MPCDGWKCCRRKSVVASEAEVELHDWARIEEGPLGLSVRCSALGLRPGVWPKTIPAKIGSGEPFVKVGYRAGRTDAMLYEQPGRCLMLTVVTK